jgi:hypothetical protein
MGVPYVSLTYKLTDGVFITLALVVTVLPAVVTTLATSQFCAPAREGVYSAEYVPSPLSSTSRNSSSMGFATPLCR